MIDQPDSRNAPPLEDGETEPGPGETEQSERSFQETDEDKLWVSRSRSAHKGSDDWFSSSIRKDVERALSNFSSKHPYGSKYHTTYYNKRSRLFRPKTRSMVRGTEAAAAIAFFSTADAVDCQAYNSGNQEQVLAAKIHKDILNHRLGDASQMPWFLTVVGAVQDAVTTGVVISYQTWDYRSRIIDVNGREAEIVEQDTPHVELIPIENFRFSPAAKWYDPIGTSPFTIHMEAMYICDIKDLMEQKLQNGDPIYRRLPDSLLQAANKQDWDTIRRVRDGERRIDVHEAATEIRDYDTIWVHHNVIKVDGQDYCYDTIGTEMMLSFKVRPLFEAYRHNMRPYAMGFSVIETHKVYPQSPVMLVDSLQEEANDLVNLRLDNVRLALGKRFFVRRGRGVDTTSLTRNVPSSVTMVADPTDIKELPTQDVTRSSYEEQDRINMDFDELAGRFSQSSVGSNRKLGETVGGMTMLRQDANEIQEYQIRVVAETWLEPVMRQLVALESVYESDPELLAMVGEPYELGPEDVIRLLRKKIKTTVAVGFNATDPEKRISRLALGLNTMSTLFPQVVQRGDPVEIGKEVFGALGYKDPTRFLPMLKRDAQQDPRVAALEQQVQDLTQQLEGKQMEIQGRIEVANIGAQARLAAENIRAKVKQWEVEAKGKIEVVLMRMKQELERIDRAVLVEDNDIRRRELYLQREALSHNITESDRDFRLELMKLGQEKEAGDADRAVDMQKNGGPKDLKGEDKAGTIGRDQFGDIPAMGG